MQNPNQSPREKEIDSEAQTPSPDGASRRSVNTDDTGHDGQIPSTASPAGAKEELVSSFLHQNRECWLTKLGAALTTGDLGRTRRPRKSKELVIRSSMASYRNCLCLHLHFACLDHHDGAGFGDHRPRSQYTPGLCAVPHPIHLCPRIRFRAVSRRASV